MIYISYFGKKNFSKENGISIARYTNIDIPSYLDLAPSKELIGWWNNVVKVNNLEDSKKAKNVYIKRYLEETLSKLNPHKVAKDLNNKVLLCYERNGKFCHRYIVAQWLRKYGYEVEEI